MIRRSTFKPPLESIPQTLARAAGDWHAADYFIAADTPLQVLTTLLRPDYYCLFLCVEGRLKGAVNDRPVELQPYCLAAIAPGSLISVTEVSPYCKGRFVLFTRDFLLRRNINPTLLEALHYLGAQTGYCVHLNKKTAGLLLQLYALLLKKRKEAESGFQEEIVRTLFYTYIYEAALVFRSNGGHPAPGLNRHEDLLKKFSALLAEHEPQGTLPEVLCRCAVYHAPVPDPCHQTSLRPNPGRPDRRGPGCRSQAAADGQQP